ncbi:hypothetical protein BS585_20780 [Vibrio parahaemolyticus]|nr:hypothetical protein BS585_20780 [Vibrio parahaemolyticus]
MKPHLKSVDYNYNYDIDKDIKILLVRRKKEESDIENRERVNDSLFREVFSRIREHKDFQIKKEDAKNVFIKFLNYNRLIIDVIQDEFNFSCPDEALRLIHLVMDKFHKINSPTCRIGKTACFHRIFSNTSYWMFLSISSLLIKENMLIDLNNLINYRPALDNTKKSDTYLIYFNHWIKTDLDSDLFKYMLSLLQDDDVLSDLIDAEIMLLIYSCNVNDNKNKWIPTFTALIAKDFRFRSVFCNGLPFLEKMKNEVEFKKISEAFNFQTREELLEKLKKYDDCIGLRLASKYIFDAIESPSL